MEIASRRPDDRTYQAHVQLVLHEAALIRVGLHHLPDYALILAVVKDIGYFTLQVQGTFPDHGRGIEFSKEGIEKIRFVEVFSRFTSTYVHLADDIFRRDIDAECFGFVNSDPGIAAFKEAEENVPAEIEQRNISDYQEIGFIIDELSNQNDSQGT